VDARKALEVQLDPRTAPVVPPARPAVGGVLPVWVAVVAGVLGPGLAVVRSLLEPAPPDPDAAVPLVAMVIGVAELGAWVGAAWAGLFRRPTALLWAVGAALAAVVGTVACPTTGHHSLGGWWYAELAVCVGALVAISVAALRRFLVISAGMAR
jgi:hypothetical protein